MVPQQDRAEATRRRIVAAGVALFGEVGFGMVDMVDVIARAGVSKGACYYHFPTKQSLAAAIIDESNARIAAAIAPIWESEAPALHRLASGCPGDRPVGVAHTTALNRAPRRSRRWPI
jgi:AcrR family transcriptional regulator